MHNTRMIGSFLLILTIFMLSGCHKQTYEPASVSFSVPAGTCSEGAVLQLSAPPDYTIRYTTDGTTPDETAMVYSAGIVLAGSGNSWLTAETADLIKIEGIYELNESAQLPDAYVIRAVAFAPDGTAGPVSTGTYFPGRSLVSEFSGTAVISLVTDPASLLDYDRGIMVKGHIFDDWISDADNKASLSDNNLWYLIQGNYTQKGKEWERPVSVELFDGSDVLSFQQDAGLRLQGTASRMFTHKSFRLYARKEYGLSTFTYPIFADDETDTYKYITLRNGGNAAVNLICKDSWQQSLLTEKRFLTQKTRPAVVYLNGEYWGVYCLIDRYCEEYLEDRYGLQDVLIIKDGEYEDGNEKAFYLYEELLAFADKDFTDPAVWQQFCETVDVHSMTDYFAAMIYMANYDFRPDKNFELWRSVDTVRENEYGDGRWRFMMYDTEFSSGMYSDGRVAWNRDSLLDVTDNFPVFASALQAPEFREMLLASLKEIGKVDLVPERVSETLDQWDQEWFDLMQDQYLRFGDYSAAWRQQISRIKNFYARRYDFIISLAENRLNAFGD